MKLTSLDLQLFGGGKGGGGGVNYISPEQKLLPEPTWEKNIRNDITGQYYGNGANSLDSSLNNNQNVYSGYQSLASGSLPSSYMDNFNKSISDSVQSSLGSLLADQASRGVIGSSQYDSGVNNIAKNVANAAASNYLNSMSTQSGLLGNMANMNNSNISNALNMYNNSANRRYSVQGDAVVNNSDGGKGSVLGGLASGWASTW